ncbi:ABC transporter transmembrane domain-containing protein [Niveispirillum irakense]|uniref:ABC transporter transmembrane domain-containing protein n=1 Tax=Niveispirillum irakense TaxID=34011 RepID=UPI0003F6C47C|nr:ABC transporter transmembrane domain-containing protein [Niveispirillum irakense]
MSKTEVTMVPFLGEAVRIAFAKPHLGLLLGLGLVIQVGFNLALPVTYKFIFDGAIARNDMAFLVELLLLLGGLYALNGAAGLVQDYTTARIGANHAATLRERLFRHIQAQGPGFYARVPEGDVVAGFGPDVAAVETALVRAFPSFVMRFMTITLSTIVLFAIEWRLALVALGLMPLLFLAPRPFSPAARAMGRQRDDQQAQVAAFVQENILTHLAIRTFNLRGERMRQLMDRLDTLRRVGFRAHYMTSLVGRAAVLAAGLLQIIVLGVGAWLATSGYMTTGLLIAFIGLLLNIGGATDQLTQAIPLLMNGAGGLNRIRGVLSHKPDLVDPPDAQPLAPLNREMTLRDVEFGYTPDNLILRGVTLSIPAGKTVAIVGSSGSGKSTVLSLLVRLYDPVKGIVAYDGTDLRTTLEESFRQQTSIVLQNTALFDTSIRENIRMGRLDATDEEVEAAARAANLHDIILDLPAGYETRVGSQGGLLSGGQRQRVAIARALLRRSNVLFLDEATSALDAVTETEINATLKQVMGGWTVVSVTHRLQHITDYDLILVMDKGRLAELGTHDELLEKDGLYAALWAKQSGFTIQDGTASITPDRLRNIPFLAACDEGVLRTLSGQLVTETFPAGRIVFQEGDPGNKFYIIARGRLENYVQWGEGREHVLGVMEDGDWFGELALIEPVPRTWCVRTITDTVCLTLDRKHFLALLDSTPKLRETVEATAYGRMAALKEAILDSIEI